MAYDENLADRIRATFDHKHVHYRELKMMGGLCFMVDDKMCVGVTGDRLMARVGKEGYEDAISREGCIPMDFTGRPLSGFVYVLPDAIDTEDELDEWIQICLNYNPLAKASKKKK